MTKPTDYLATILRSSRSRLKNIYASIEYDIFCFSTFPSALKQGQQFIVIDFALWAFQHPTFSKDLDAWKELLSNRYRACVVLDFRRRHLVLLLILLIAINSKSLVAIGRSLRCYAFLKGTLNSGSVPFNEITTAAWDNTLRVGIDLQSFKNTDAYSSIDKQSLPSRYNEHLVDLYIIQALILSLRLHTSCSAISVGQVSYHQNAIIHNTTKYGLQLLLRSAIACDNSVLITNKKEDVTKSLSPSNLIQASNQINGFEASCASYLCKASVILGQRCNHNYDNTMGYMQSVKQVSYLEEDLNGYCIFFLHCFLDGPNGYLTNSEQSTCIDYYHFYTEIVQSVLDAGLNIAIKPHPSHSSVLESRLLSRYLQNLKDIIYPQNRQLIILGLDVSNASIFAANPSLVLSARGSVLLEAAFSRVPSISSSSTIHTHYNISQRIPKSKHQWTSFIYNASRVDRRFLNKARLSAIKYVAEAQYLRSIYRRPHSMDIYNPNTQSPTLSELNHHNSNLITI